jgi:hypothetical protein
MHGGWRGGVEMKDGGEGGGMIKEGLSQVRRLTCSRIIRVTVARARAEL